MFIILLFCVSFYMLVLPLFFTTLYITRVYTVLISISCRITRKRGALCWITSWNLWTKDNWVFERYWKFIIFVTISHASSGKLACCFWVKRFTFCLISRGSWSIRFSCKAPYFFSSDFDFSWILVSNFAEWNWNVVKRITFQHLQYVCLYTGQRYAFVFNSIINKFNKVNNLFPGTGKVSRLYN